MENLSYYLLLLLTFVFFILFKRHSSDHKTRKTPPSPPSLPIIGHLHLLKGTLYEALASLSSQYGPILYLRVGWTKFAIVSSPSAIEECFTKNDVVLANRPHTVAADRLTYNYNAYVFSPYGDFWKTLRKLSVVEVFSSQSLGKSAGTREEVISAVMRALYKRCKNGGQKVDLSYLLSGYSCNIMMKNMTGRFCIGEEDIWSEVGKETVNQISGTFFSNLSIGLCDFFPILRWFGYKGLEKDMILLQKKRDQFLQSLVDEVRARKDVSGEKDKRSLIETLLSLQESDPEFYTEEIVKSVLLVMIIAGTQPPALAAEWAMSLLLTHPEELQKLRQEIDNKVGHDRLINDSDLPNLPYIRCVVNEALRLFPPAPLLLPHYSSDNCVVGGYNIPKDTILLANAWAMQRDPNVWEEPHKFNPERFKAIEMEKEGKFVPFGMGRRACPGEGMALRTTSLAVGAFVQCFEWRKEDVEMDTTFESGIVLQRTKPLETVCVPRDQAMDLLLQL